MCLSIHPCICPSLCSSSHPSIYLAIHEFIWTWTFLAIFRSSDPCVHRSFHLPVYCRSFSLSSHASFDLSLDVRMDLAKHRSVYVSMDFETTIRPHKLSINLSIYRPIYLSMYLSISPCIDLCIYRCIYLSLYLSIYQCNVAWGSVI